MIFFIVFVLFVLRFLSLSQYGNCCLLLLAFCWLFGVGVVVGLFLLSLVSFGVTIYLGRRVFCFVHCFLSFLFVVCCSYIYLFCCCCFCLLLFVLLFCLLLFVVVCFCYAYILAVKQ